MQTFEEYYNMRPTTFVDMDGCLVDFIHGAKRYKPELRQGQYSKFTYQDWRHIRQDQPDFWLNLPVLEHGLDLWRVVNKYCPSILTAYPADWKSASSQKLEWCRQYLPKFGYCPRQSFYCVDRVEKQNYARLNGIPNLLIDDHERNISEWEAAGGVGVLYEPSATMISTVAQVLKEMYGN